ncbi:MAG: globin [Candidatus Nanopelagicales bacterium]|nr:globin [Candidatus Nanopelagicales bacterium]
MERTLFELVGGEEFFVKLVDGFYQGIETDEVLRVMYQGHDLVQARRHLALFLQQYWGGPTIYQSERGHPRLRMRHMPFVIDPDARDRWLDHMQASLEQLEMPLTAREELWNYLVAAANSLVNSE